ncbi:hypothetical protein [Methanosarcina barkeri]|uniref:hypothetical protein n=1 Tax=Methanosarcina barkeri TaxID=2208 RepID=UPI000A68A897|nr:hypothetical protein [Methanosarcina barkeri]
MTATVDPKPLRRFVTPIGFGDKFLKSKCYWGFRSSLFEKACGKAIFEKACG